MSRRVDYMDREPREQTVLRINDDGSLSSIPQDFEATLMILQDDEEQYPLSRKKMQIPHERIWDCIRRHHDPKEYGHGGIANTMRAIQRNCHFSGMKKHVASFISKCEQCRKNKHDTHKAYNVPQKIEPATRKWQSIIIDFIIKLPKSKDPVTGVTYNNI